MRPLMCLIDAPVLLAVVLAAASGQAAPPCCSSCMAHLRPRNTTAQQAAVAVRLLADGHWLLPQQVGLLRTGTHWERSPLYMQCVQYTVDAVYIVIAASSATGWPVVHASSHSGHLHAWHPAANPADSSWQELPMLLQAC
jgi:hypothetical protein